MLIRRAFLLSSSLLLALTPVAQAKGPSPGYHPWAHDHVGPLEIDVNDAIAHPERYRQTPVEQPDFHALPDEAAAPAPARAPGRPGRTPEGWVQRGSMVLPAPVATGDYEVDPDVAHGMQVVPGNEYPRKHTLFLNFNGGMLYSGSDNSAEDSSTLAKQGIYPTYEGTEQKALSIIQAVTEDVSAYGIQVIYLERPNKTVPYTMEMVGGEWSDTNIDSPAGGVAPGADCGALGQRHVVYTFASGGTPALQAANTASQEAGHAWGLDHNLNCNSVMSYCGVGDGVFSDTCDGLCEAACQGAAGCRLTHDVFCGEGNDQQNEVAELSFLFGGNEPDMEPPSVEIIEPMDGQQIEVDGGVDVRTLISDNYGGYGWYYLVTHDGEVIIDQVDYDRQVDEMYRPALNLGGLLAGEWVITVGAEDQFGHITEDSVTVFVGMPSDTGTVDSSGGEPTTGPLDGGETEDSSGTSGPEIDDSVDDGGCECRATPTGGTLGWAGLLGLGACAWRRRRR
jgi:hypothetical protein